MSATRNVLGLLSPLTEQDSEGLLKVLIQRGIGVDPSGSLLELCRQLSTREAVWSGLEQLPRADLLLLGELESAPELERERFHTLLLIEGREDKWRLRPEVAELWPEIEEILDKTESGETEHKPVAAAPTLGEPELSTVFSTIENVERLVTELEAEPFCTPEHLTAAHWEKLGQRVSLGPPALEGALGLGLRLGLVTHRHGSWSTTVRGGQWRNRGSAEKWVELVEGFLATLPSWWPDPLPGDCRLESVLASITTRFPLVTPYGVEQILNRASSVGLIRANAPTTLSTARTRRDLSSVISGLMPPTVDQLYPDGPDTVVAAGPLSPEVENALRQCGRWVSGGLTPRFQITPRTIVGALQSGWTGDQLLDVLGRVVLGGLNSALGEQVRDTVEKANSLSLSENQTGCSATCSTELLAKLLLADRRLHTAQWKVAGELILHSDRPLWEVHSLLLDESYPHLVRDTEGDLLPSPSSNQLSPSGRLTNQWTSQLVASMQEGFRHEKQSSTFWLTVLELAVRDRTPITVEVDVAGEHRQLSIEPHAVKNGRLRGLDLRSDVERTIPVSHVVDVRPA